MNICFCGSFVLDAGDSEVNSTWSSFWFWGEIRVWVVEEGQGERGDTISIFLYFCLASDHYRMENQDSSFVHQLYDDMKNTYE